MSRRRIVALGVPVAVLVFALGFVVGLEVRRGPDWRLELDEYVARERVPGETIRVEAVVRARKPWNFTPAMGTVEWERGIAPSPLLVVATVLFIALLAGGQEELSETPTRVIPTGAQEAQRLQRSGGISASW